MLYASCKKLLIRCTSNSFLSTTCAPLFFRQMLKSGVMSAIVTNRSFVLAQTSVPSLLVQSSFARDDVRFCFAGRGAAKPAKASRARTNEERQH